MPAAARQGEAGSGDAYGECDDDGIAQLVGFEAHDSLSPRGLMSSAIGKQGGHAVAHHEPLTHGCPDSS